MRLLSQLLPKVTVTS